MSGRAEEARAVVRARARLDADQRAGPARRSRRPAPPLWKSRARAERRQVVRLLQRRDVVPPERAVGAALRRRVDGAHAAEVVHAVEESPRVACAEDDFRNSGPKTSSSSAKTRNPARGLRRRRGPDAAPSPGGSAATSKPGAPVTMSPRIVMQTQHAAMQSRQRQSVQRPVACRGREFDRSAGRPRISPKFRRDVQDHARSTRRTKEKHVWVPRGRVARSSGPASPSTATSRAAAASSRRETCVRPQHADMAARGRPRRVSARMLCCACVSRSLGGKVGAGRESRRFCDAPAAARCPKDRRTVQGAAQRKQFLEKPIPSSR